MDPFIFYLYLFMDLIFCVILVPQSKLIWISFYLTIFQSFFFFFWNDHFSSLMVIKVKNSVKYRQFYCFVLLWSLWSSNLLCFCLIFSVWFLLHGIWIKFEVFLLFMIEILMFALVSYRVPNWSSIYIKVIYSIVAQDSSFSLKKFQILRQKKLHCFFCFLF